MKWNKYTKVTLGATLTILAFTLSVAIFGLLHPAGAEGALASDEHLVTIYDRGTEHSLITKADSLRAVFAAQHIVLDKNDIVEPSLDEQLVAKDYQVNIYRARPVTIVDGSHQIRVMSAYQTPQQIAQQAGITLRDEDEETLSLPTDLVSDGASIRMVVKRATPIRLTFYGKRETVYTQAATVADFLREKTITLADKDEMNVSEKTPITPDMKLEIWREGVQTLTRNETIKFTTREIQDADHPVGYRKIQTAGSNGKKTVTYKVTIKNGKQIKKKVIHTIVLKKSIQEVAIVGTKMKNSFSGSFAGALARLRSCEGGYTTNTGNGYYGAYQYDAGTWGNYKGYRVASDAPPSVQDEKAWQTYQSRGWSPWPSCSISQGLQDIYR